jgi:hypothetical protein
VQPGQQYYLTPKVWNPSAIDANPLNLEVESLNPGLIVNPGVSASGSYDTGASYRNGGCSSGVNPCWQYVYGNGLKAGQVSTETDGVTFKVSPGAAQGSSVCFRLYVHPSNQGSGTLYMPSAAGSYCFLVYSPVYPSVVGQSGDVHAGGGLCGGATAPSASGVVKGNPNGASLGQYVTSASAAVSGFGSNNSPSSSANNNLTLGTTPTHGYYAQVCRPDLYNHVAKPAINAGSVGFCTAVGTLDLSNLPAGCNAVDVVVFNGPGSLDVKETGAPLSKKLTLVAMNHGDIVIDNDIIVAAAGVNRSNVPSLGIIADGNIGIKAAVTTVDAYLFADSNIDTCLEAGSSVTRSQCFTPTLTINGFTMAYQLQFRRLAALNAVPGCSCSIAEKVMLTSPIYLNPPRFFDDSVDMTTLNGQGERQPLY